MARKKFPDEASRLVLAPGQGYGSDLESAAGVRVQIFFNEAGTQLADITDMNGGFLSDAVIIVNEDSLIPDFLGPDDGTVKLYAKPVGTNTVSPIYAALDQYSQTFQDKYFRFVQGLPSSVWYITHNLGKKPSVTVEDSNGNEVIGDTQYIDNNTVELHFSGPFSGEAHLN